MQKVAAPAPRVSAAGGSSRTRPPFVDKYGEQGDDDFADALLAVPVHPGRTRRDQIAVERVGSGLLKVLDPHGQFTDAELLEVVTFAAELRQRIDE